MRTSLVTAMLMVLATELAHATEPDSYSYDMFQPLPAGSDEAAVVEVGAEYRPRAESSPLGPIRFNAANPNTEFSHRARLMTVLAHDRLRAKFTFQNVYRAGSPEAIAPVEALEAYIEYGSDRLRSRVGRQEITFGTGRILTAPFWSQRGRPIDAIRLDYRGDEARADVFLGRHNGSGINRDLAGAYLEHDFDALRTALTALYETNRWIPGDRRVGFQEGYRRFTSGFDVEHRGPLTLTAEALVQLGSFEGDGSLIGGPTSGGGTIRSWFAGASVGYEVARWLTPVVFAEFLSGDADFSDDTVGVFDTVLGYRRRFYGRIDRFIRIPSDTRGGGLWNAGVRTASPLAGGEFFTEWHYFHIPEVDIDGSRGPAGAELDLRYVYPLTDHLNIELAYFTYFRLGDYRQVPGTGRRREVTIKPYGYVQLDLQI